MIDGDDLFTEEFLRGIKKLEDANVAVSTFSA